MNKHILNFALITFISIAFISCKKEEEKEVEPTTVTISMSEPAVNDTIPFNGELHIEGTISASSEVHGYSLSATNTTTSASLLSVNYDVHATTYNFHEHLVNTLTDTTTVKVKIVVTKDHDGNQEINERNVVFLPQ
ncbi:MAG: hypothetical protein V4622_00625 [Bacteroidota bacterium]